MTETPTGFATPAQAAQAGVFPVAQPTDDAAPSAPAVETDVEALKRSMAAMAARIEAMEAEKKATAGEPRLVTLARAVTGWLGYHEGARPAIRDDPDWNYKPENTLAGQLSKAAESESPDSKVVSNVTGQLERRLAKRARRFPGHDYSALLGVVEEAVEEAAKLAA
jgi:hypothetical protein